MMYNLGKVTQDFFPKHIKSIAEEKGETATFQAFLCGLIYW